jgi:hypothetical protein
MRRAAALLLAAAALVLVVPATAQAHGIGGRLDLPVPMSFFVVGASVVLVASFVALAVMWPKPRLQDGPRSRPIRAGWMRPLFGAAQVVGVAGLLVVVAAGAVDLVKDSSGRNIAPVLVWIGFWLVVPFLGAVVGNLYTAVNPWRTIAASIGLGDTERPDLVSKAGVWPAAVGLVAFAWMELVNPNGAAPSTLAAAAVLYSIYLFVMVSRFGRESAFTAADIFTPYTRLISSIAPLGRDAEGRPIWRGWLRALPVLPEWKGLAPFVIVMIGTVSYDGLSATVWWGQSLPFLKGSVWVETLSLVAMCALIGAAYYGACALAARIGGDEGGTARTASRFAHTLVPIAFAYAFAHYFTLILFEGQLIISSISDPFGLGWDLFGTAGRMVDFFLTPVAVWYVQVLAIVTGHVLGVILAHDRALADYPAERAVRSQYAMLGLMVALTGLGLVILAG